MSDGSVPDEEPGQSDGHRPPVSSAPRDVEKGRRDVSRMQSFIDRLKQIVIVASLLGEIVAKIRGIFRGL